MQAGDQVLNVIEDVRAAASPSAAIEALRTLGNSELHKVSSSRLDRLLKALRNAGVEVSKPQTGDLVSPVLDLLALSSAGASDRDDVIPEAQRPPRPAIRSEDPTTDSEPPQQIQRTSRSTPISSPPAPATTRGSARSETQPSQLPDAESRTQDMLLQIMSRLDQLEKQSQPISNAPTSRRTASTSAPAQPLGNQPTQDDMTDGDDESDLLRALQSHHSRLPPRVLPERPNQGRAAPIVATPPAPALATRDTGADRNDSGDDIMVFESRSPLSPSPADQNVDQHLNLLRPRDPTHRRRALPHANEATVIINWIASQGVNLQQVIQSFGLNARDTQEAEVHAKALNLLADQFHVRDLAKIDAADTLARRLLSLMVASKTSRDYAKFFEEPAGSSLAPPSMIAQANKLFNQSQTAFRAEPASVPNRAPRQRQSRVRDQEAKKTRGSWDNPKLTVRVPRTRDNRQ